MEESDRPLSVRARKKVKAQIEKNEREKLLGLFQKRMELARAGAIAFKATKYKEAVSNYFRYIDILEKTKSVKSGGLSPRVFDVKKDVAELLLLTGVYWDLSKLHDKVSQKDLTKLNMYLDQFVSFSKGMSYQHVSAELVRKYLINGTPKHRKLFKDTHIRLGGGKCFMVTAVEDYCAIETLPTLRKFRDQKLLKNCFGRNFVSFYYKIGPTLARGVLRMPEVAQKALAKVFDRIALGLMR